MFRFHLPSRVSEHKDSSIAATTRSHETDPRARHRIEGQWPRGCAIGELPPPWRKPPPRRERYLPNGLGHSRHYPNKLTSVVGQTNAADHYAHVNLVPGRATVRRTLKLETETAGRQDADRTNITSRLLPKPAWPGVEKVVLKKREGRQRRGVDGHLGRNRPPRKLGRWHGLTCESWRNGLGKHAFLVFHLMVRYSRRFVSFEE